MNAVRRFAALLVVLVLPTNSIAVLVRSGASSRVLELPFASEFMQPTSALALHSMLTNSKAGKLLIESDPFWGKITGLLNEDPRRFYRILGPLDSVLFSPDTQEHWSRLNGRDAPSERSALESYLREIDSAPDGQQASLIIVLRDAKAKAAELIEDAEEKALKKMENGAGSANGWAALRREFDTMQYYSDKAVQNLDVARAKANHARQSGVEAVEAAGTAAMGAQALGGPSPSARAIPTPQATGPESKGTTLERYGIVYHRESPMVTVIRDIEAVGPRTNVPVLIIGASGTGKELIARALHEVSGSKGTFVAVNMTTFPTELFESQLFGNTRGAFTGASAEKMGFFQEADKGTLFLDEIGVMPLQQQPKLLRVLESGEYYRVGESKPRRSAARLVSATNIALTKLIREGQFRNDLYYRLNTFEIRVPPLEKRAMDIEVLALRFLDELRQSYAVPNIEFTQSALQALTNYPWPGNVRQLRNAIEQAVIRSDGKKEIDSDALRLPRTAKSPAKS